MTTDDQWYKDAIFYELQVKSFYDSNADGIGDFRGLVEKLDYLKDLGVDCIWVTPFFPSPLKDDGYDIADFYGVHSDFGTLQDAKYFIKEAHRRGLKVMFDLVMNHTSDQHPWVQEARSDPKSPRRNYYVWSDTDQKYLDARIIFTDTERSNWTWDPVAKQYFWHRFFSHQPDLNYDNPRVRRSIFKIMRHWLELGVDGFRADAIPYLFEREGTNGENLPETHAYLKEVRREVDRQFPGRILLAEANQWPADVRPYFGDGDEFHMAFNFPVMPRIYMALRREDRTPIMEIISQLPNIPEASQWCLFLRNHDELTLEMVTDEERDYIYLGDRNGVRTPMQWSGDRNAGFSRADAARLYNPVIMDPVYGYQAINVEAQQRDPSSLLNWMKRLIRLGKQYPVFGRGAIEFCHPENRKVLVYIRKGEGQTVLVVNNLSRFVQPVQLDLRQYDGWTPIEIIGETPFPRIGELPYFLTLGPHGFYWFRLEAPHES